jgi:hypothetical protein
MLHIVSADQTINLTKHCSLVLHPYLNSCHHWHYAQCLTIYLIQNINSNIYKIVCHIWNLFSDKSIIIKYIHTIFITLFDGSIGLSPGPANQPTNRLTDLTRCLRIQPNDPMRACVDSIMLWLSKPFCYRDKLFCYISQSFCDFVYHLWFLSVILLQCSIISWFH